VLLEFAAGFHGEVPVVRGRFAGGQIEVVVDVRGGSAGDDTTEDNPQQSHRASSPALGNMSP